MSSGDNEECLLHFDTLSNVGGLRDVSRNSADKIKDARDLLKERQNIDWEFAKVCSAIDQWTSKRELHDGAKYHVNCYTKFMRVRFEIFEPTTV